VAKAPTPKRYALALFQLAEGQGKQEPWLEELQRAQATLDDATISTYLSTPRVRIGDKLNVVKQILDGCDPMVANLIGLLVSRQTLSLLPGLITAYGELLNTSLGRVQAQVTSSVPLSDEQQTRLREMLRKMLDKDVELEAKVDTDTIGGMVIRVGDQVIDGSVRTRLEALKQRLEHESLA
jgi:F-type H+-transporting ATPase subunit delta